MAYSICPLHAKASANVILGINAPKGKLPVTTNRYKYGCGLSFTPIAQNKALTMSGAFQKKFGAVDSIAPRGYFGKKYTRAAR